ncbi:MAG: arginase family protein [Nanoarchaeota archaeon]|nr:arginase family protein [Nanoarchaeota archaeon]
MKIISVPRISALGLKGPEEMGKFVLAELGRDFETIEVDNSNVESSEKNIFSRAKEIFKSGEKAVFVGGDHSISCPIFKAFNEVNKDAFLIVFDAHADCDDPAQEPTHEEWLRATIERGFDPSKVILIGVRKMWENEKKFLVENGVKIFEEINDIEAAGDYITEKANGADVYVSIDIDVLDPAFAPAVSYPEVNGLSSKELFYLLKRIFHIKSLKAIDVVEVVPEKDEKYDYRTVKIAAKIVEDFLDSDKI